MPTDPFKVLEACMLPHYPWETIFSPDQILTRRRRDEMLITRKMLLALTLVAALMGGGVGALITHSTAKAENEQPATTTTAPATNPTLASYQTDMTPEQIEAANAARFKTTEEQTAYRQGFEDGFAVCGNTQASTANRTVAYSAPARRYSNGSRRAYYDYKNQPPSRSFWQKHRDKLTMAIGTGGGALIGGLIGGKKGAGIGALAGLGGSALYTYKLRKRSPRSY
jgi:hypothetical protein